ncbi:1,4-dihydroxy-2-naphthoate octaprenyltransferase [uncultured Prevotella sp.]|uniref:1,4-dihydroxy-2-naphthoate octaprenyltransferase n=1 Tax=uncultured Prevotella sp. TaxID=159272 RepID=UPI002636A46D|nr:1,4-dihydroxy-2-naphthoate octaprenyltransferase [uncultured Prevotella sp.]
MDKEIIRKNSFKAWLLAARPKTLTGASVPVMIALAMAYTDLQGNGFRIIPAVLCALFAFVMQIDANFVNDYFDFISGKDDEQRLGPARACAMGWIDVAKMKVGIVITTVIACIIGLPLVIYGGVEMILVGALCVVFCFLYTTLLASRGLGDLLVLVFFGIVPVCATYYLQTDTCTWVVFLASLACGLVIDTLLVVNNYRDIDNDRRAGKKTLIVMIGADKGRLLYLWLGIIASLMGVVFAVYGKYWTPLLPTVYLIMHIATYRRMVKIGSGRQLNLVLADTARNMFVYGLTLSLGLLLS